MKQIKSYTSDIQQLGKFAFAALIGFAGVITASAQDESDDDAAPAEEVVAKPQVKKPTKTYPMKEIKGKVVDAATGEALAGVQVKSFNNSYYTAMTDEDGTYTIKVPTFVTSLSARLEGYNLSQTAINGREADVEIRLFSDKYISDYAVKNNGNKAVEIVGFENSPAISIDDEIQQRLGADVRSISRSALNGQGVAMFINGINSLNSNAQPLVILDGVVYDMMYDVELVHQGYFSNLLASINVDDIEDVKVLKNGTAIYGAKAANGVIIINTKRNKSMATRIDVNASWGMEFLPNTIDVMNADQYRSYASQLLKTTPTKLNEFKFLKTDPNYYYYNMYHNNTNWKNVSYDEAMTQNYSIHIQGGDDVANYNLSVGYTDAEATLKNNDMNRFNIRFNTDILLNQWFTTRFDASYTNITRNLRDAGLERDFDAQSVAATNVLSLLKAPFLSPYDFDVYGRRSNFIADADDYLNEVISDGTGSLANPKAILANADAKNKNHSDLTQINVAIAPKWQPTKNFSVEERFSYTMQSYDERYYTPYIGMPTYEIKGLGTVSNSNRSLYTKHNAIFSDTRAEWALPLGAHRLDIFGGIRFQDDSFNSSNMLGYSNTNDKMPNMGTGLVYKKNTGTDYSWRSLDYYANVDYNYMEKYYLQGQLTMSTSSRFGKKADGGLNMFGVAWGFFPSLQASWVISNEDWFKTNGIVNYLKLNAGFESVGNDAIDNNATLTYMAAGTYMTNNRPYVGLANIGNTKLRWETTNRLNAGIEGRFFNDRLALRANIFKAYTNNLFTLGTVSYVTGQQDYWTNDGKLENFGYDLGLTAKLFNAEKFKMELGGTIGHYKNELTRMPSGKAEVETDIYGGTVLSRVGQAAGVFYGYKTAGVFATSQDAQNAHLDAATGTKTPLYIQDIAGNRTAFQAGDIKFVDKDNNGIIDEKDRFIIGDPNPDFYGNIFANFYIGKHWSVSTIFNYCVGNDIYNYQRAVLEGGSQYVNQSKAVTRRWTAEGQKTDIPQATYLDPMGNSRFSDRWIEDGSYLKFKTLKVAYQVPIQNEYIQGLSIWASANNLFTLTKYLGNDPEVSAGNGVLVQGIDAGFLNAGRTFTLGVKINL